MKRLCIIFLCSALFLGAVPKLQYGVESTQVFLNEPFIFQLHVTCDQDEHVDAPTVPDMPDFNVSALAPQQSSNTSMSIVNGKVTKSSTQEIYYNYQLTPKRQGTLTIPAFDIHADGKILSSKPVNVLASKSDEIKNIALECKLSTQECYVGEAVMVTWNWYIGQKIYDWAMDFPLFEMTDFTFPEYTPEITRQNQDDYIAINTQSRNNLLGWQHQTNYNGLRLNCITIKTPLIPTAPGTHTLPATNLVCKIEDLRKGRQRQRRRSPFDDFDDFFGSSTPTRQYSLASNPITLTVKPLPAEGCPANFSGIIGQCTVTATATPQEVSVGDPILLNITISGPEFPNAIRLPELSKQQTIAANFKVTGDEPGTLSDGAISFQRTIRATNDSIQEIPAIEIPYFDSSSGNYSIARSTAIPLKVEKTHAVTANDAQGIVTNPATDSTPRLSNLQETRTGLAGNADYTAVLKKQTVSENWFNRLNTRLLLLLPPIAWLLLAICKLLFHKRANSSHARSRRTATPDCLKALKQLKPDSPELVSKVTDILQEYFARRFDLKPGAITFSDIAGAAPKQQQKQLNLDKLKAVLELCEAAQYGGSTAGEDFLKSVYETISTWEK